MRKKSLENVKQRNKRHRIFTVLRVACVLLAVGSLAMVCLEKYRSVRHEEEAERLSELLRTGKQQGEGTAPAPDERDGDGGTAEPAESPGKPEIMERFRNLYKKNNDLAGWLLIPGTNIDYPVMQCKDDEYYLHHNFEKKEDKYGCLYVRKRADVNTPGMNFIIYGHNMKDGSMFGNLDQYREKSYYKKHSVLYFDTLYGERCYKIMAVFLSQVYDSDDDEFKYYEWYEADTEEDFRIFYDNIKNLALYETGVKAEFGDKFLMLSTCAYHVEDGRLVVVAKQVEQDGVALE